MAVKKLDKKTEEKITKAAGSVAGIGMTERELIGIVREEGFTPTERDALYRTEF